MLPKIWRTPGSYLRHLISLKKSDKVCGRISDRFKIGGSCDCKHPIKNGGIMCLENVICTEDDLTKNLLSLRKLADIGLSIYLDNRQIDIFYPVSHELFIRGIYQKPYWITEQDVEKKTQITNVKDWRKVIRWEREPFWQQKYLTMNLGTWLVAKLKLRINQNLIRTKSIDDAAQRKNE